MKLKQTSITISLVSTLILITSTLLIINQVGLVKFQEIENQRVERNIRRTSAVIDDKLEQINRKLTDWAIWDDAYNFMSDHDPNFISTNLSQESIKNMGLDQILFINKKGGLETSISVGEESQSDKTISLNLYSHFATGSSLLKIKKDIGYNKGVVMSNNRATLFVVRNIFKSDNSGMSNGSIVFATYFDNKAINSLRALTQFEAIMTLWSDPKIPSDFQDVKDLYINQGTKSLTKILNQQTISGYLVVEDIYEKPAFIVRTDIDREIALQGADTRMRLLLLIFGIEVVTALINYLTLTKTVLSKILNISQDIKKLSQSQSEEDRLTVGKASDEIDLLRAEINNLIDSVHSSKSALQNKEEFINSVMDNLNVGIAVNHISTGKAIYMNQAFQDIYGWPKEELKSVEDFFEKVYPDPSVREATKTRILNDIKSGDKEKMHWPGLEITKQNGKKGIVDAANIPLLEQDLMVSTVIDVTQTAKEEKRKEEYAKELESLNAAMINRELKMIELKQKLAHPDE